MATIDVTSPIDGRVVGSVPAATAADVVAAYERLQAAQPAWAARSCQDRGAILSAAAQSLRDAADELAESLVVEIGKTPAEAKAEIVRTADLVEQTISEAAKLTPFTIDDPGTPGRQQTVERVPVGVVLAIGPFNYPINLSISKIAPALLMGNAVLFKPPTSGSVTARRVAELFTEVGVPEDVLVTITGKSSEIGDALVENEAIGMIALTGSTAVGTKIAKQSGMVGLLLELGGNDSAVVLEDADLDLAAKHIAKGAFQYSGQRCTAVKRVYVVESVADEFVAKLKEQVTANYGSAGDPHEHPVGPVIDEKQAEYLQELLDDAVASGGQVACGGSRDGRFIEATIVDNLKHETRLVTEEQFGPILPIVRVANADEAIRLADDSEYGLQSSIFTADQDRGRELAERLHVGGVHLNGPDQRGPDTFLFTADKRSGIGSQGIRFALEAMSKHRGIVTNP